MDFFKKRKLLQSSDLEPCPFCKSKMHVINIRDDKVISELPKEMLFDREHEIDLIVLCSNDDSKCQFNYYFNTISLVTYDSMEEFKKFWNNRK